MNASVSRTLHRAAAWHVKRATEGWILRLPLREDVGLHKHGLDKVFWP